MRFIRAAAQTTIAQSVSMVCQFLMGVITARALGPEGVGILALTLIFSDFAFRIGNLGFGSAFAFYVARDPAKYPYYLWLALRLPFAAATLVCLGFFAIWNASFSPWVDVPMKYFFLAVPVVLFTFANDAMMRICSGSLQITSINVAEVVISSGQVILFVIASRYTDWGAAGAVASFAFSQAIGFVILLIAMRRWVRRTANPAAEPACQHGEIRKLWMYGRWNYMLLFVNFLLEECPTLLLKSFWTTSAVGLFARARNLCRYPQFVVLPFARILFPFTASTANPKDSVLRTNLLSKAMVWGLIPPALLMMVLARWLLVLLYGPEFASAASVFRAALPSMVLFPLTQFLAIHIAAIGKPKAVFMTSALALVVGSLPAFLLIKTWGAVGAAWAVSVIAAILTTTRVWLYMRETRTSLAELLLPTWRDLSALQQQWKNIRGRTAQAS